MTRFLSRLAASFRCPGCVARQGELDHLRCEVHTLQAMLQKAHQEAQDKIVQLAKDCNDRVMSRSYTEYAVGAAASESPRPPQSRSDEEEWLIEQRRQKEVEREVQESLRGVGDGARG